MKCIGFSIELRGDLRILCEFLHIPRKLLQIPSTCAHTAFRDTSGLVDDAKITVTFAVRREFLKQHSLQPHHIGGVGTDAMYVQARHSLPAHLRNAQLRS